MKLQQRDIEVLTNAVVQFFSTLPCATRTPQGRSVARDLSPAVRSSHLAEYTRDLPRADYCGVVTLSGEYEGWVAFSAPKALLERVLIDLEDPDHTEAGKLDLVGEIANQMIGPAQRHFGDGMAISVPKTGVGNASRVLVEAKAKGGSASPLLLPIRWEGFEAGLLVSIQRPEGRTQR